MLLLCAMTISKNIRGFCFALLGGISWGFSGACAQYLFHHCNVDPLWVSSVRMLCAGIVLCAFALAIARGPFLAMWRNRNTVGSLVIFSVFGLASCQITYLLAIQHSNAGTATVIQYIAPVLVVLYLCIRSHRRPLKREVLAIALVMMGTFLVATHGNPNSLALTPAGLFWSLVSAGCSCSLVWCCLAPSLALRCISRRLKILAQRKRALSPASKRFRLLCSRCCGWKLRLAG